MIHSQLEPIDDYWANGHQLGYFRPVDYELAIATGDTANNKYITAGPRPLINYWNLSRPLSAIVWAGIAGAISVLALSFYLVHSVLSEVGGDKNVGWFFLKTFAIFCETGNMSEKVYNPRQRGIEYIILYVHFQYFIIRPSISLLMILK